ncbi:hypothetical protein ACM6N5_08275 [Rossellomorea marisflavi]|uniref:hypothetical protein n=1 Tax=Rossellomorea marisflavi TaxID=189381 RepID=UPI003AE24A56
MKFLTCIAGYSAFLSVMSYSKVSSPVRTERTGRLAGACKKTVSIRDVPAYEMGGIRWEA